MESNSSSSSSSNSISSPSSSDEQSLGGVSLPNIEAVPQNIGQDADLENQLTQNQQNNTAINQRQNASRAEERESRREKDIKRTIKSSLLAEFTDLLADEPSERIDDLKDFIKEAKSVGNNNQQGAEQEVIAGTLTKILKQDSDINPRNFEPNRSRNTTQNIEPLNTEKLAKYTQDVVMDLVSESVNGSLSQERSQSQYGVSEPYKQQPISKSQLEEVYKDTSLSLGIYEQGKNKNDIALLDKNDMQPKVSFKDSFATMSKNRTKNDWLAINTSSIIAGLGGFMSELTRGTSDFSAAGRLQMLGQAVAVGTAAGVAGNVIAKGGVLVNNAKKAYNQSQADLEMLETSPDTPVVTRNSYEENINQQIEVSSSPLEVPYGNNDELSHTAKLTRQRSNASIDSASSLPSL
jgi:hypothetical protein